MYEEMKFQELRKLCKERDIAFKPTDKKVDLIAMLEAVDCGVTDEDMSDVGVKEVEGVIEKPKKKNVFTDIMPQLEAMGEKGLTWQINEDDNTITFNKHVLTCVNLNSDAKHILSTAQAAFGGVRPVEMGRNGRTAWD